MKVDTIPLGELLDVIIDHRGKTPKKLGGDFSQSGVRVISAIHIKDGRINWSERERFVSPETFERWMPVRLLQGDVLLTSEAPLGEVTQVPSDEPLVLSQRLFALRGKSDRLDNGYLRYFLTSPTGQAALQNRATGTTVVGIRQSELLKVEVPVPPLDVQRRIAGVLGDLDDLIELNQRLAATLDEEVRLLGDHLMASALPFERRPFSEIAEIQKGYSYKSAELVPDGKWLINLKNIGRDGSFQERGFKPLSAAPKASQVIENGDIVVSQTDLTQSRDVIARPVRIRRSGRFGELVASLDLVIVRPKHGATREFLHAVLSQPEFREHALGYCNGTTVLHMGTKALPEYKAPVPDASTIRAFSEQVTPLLEAADGLLDEARDLKRTRDELLPLLMSGQVSPGEVA